MRNEGKSTKRRLDKALQVERRINSIAPPTHHKMIFPTHQNDSTAKASDLESVITPPRNTLTTRRHFSAAAPTSADGRQALSACTVPTLLS